MPELPEIASRACEMQAALVGKTIHSFEILQPKCLNIPAEDFSTCLAGATLEAASHHGKWIICETTQGYVLINLGMGGEILLRETGNPPKKYRLSIGFQDGTRLFINFWWFGYVHFVATGMLSTHAMTAKLGPDALEITEAEFTRRLRLKNTAVKTFLLDQKNLAGIGNAYIHDILFLARVHPLRKASGLDGEESHRLYTSIRNSLQSSFEKKGAFYEVDLQGKPGGFQEKDILIGYREGKPCPECGSAIQKLRTGSTTSFICPSCQLIS